MSDKDVAETKKDAPGKEGESEWKQGAARFSSYFHPATPLSIAATDHMHAANAIASTLILARK